ncbi:unnamed protein product, partial [Vitis vinifera]|uniref:Uncharacterized protein n=1 Tax=Vitis vinifera TaxID=29760 RepID=D7SRB5_VITVI
MNTNNFKFFLFFRCDEYLKELVKYTFIVPQLVHCALVLMFFIGWFHYHKGTPNLA